MPFFLNTTEKVTESPRLTCANILLSSAHYPFIFKAAFHNKALLEINYKAQKNPQLSNFKVRKHLEVSMHMQPLKYKTTVSCCCLKFEMHKKSAQGKGRNLKNYAGNNFSRCCVFSQGPSEQRRCLINRASVLRCSPVTDIHITFLHQTWQADGWKDGQMDRDRQVNGQNDGCIDGHTNEWMETDSYMDGWMDGWTDGWMDGRKDWWMDGGRYIYGWMVRLTCIWMDEWMDTDG